ncbi:hypothetical protein ACWCW7_23370 [Nocardia tengchongensis]
MSGFSFAESPVSAIAAPLVVTLPGPGSEVVRWGERHTSRVPARSRRLFDPVPEKPLTLHDSWWIVAAAALVAASALVVAVWIAVHLRVDPVLHQAGLFVHLASLALGFGGVLMADYLVLRWLAGRSTFADAVQSANRLHAPIWAGLAGLIASGCVLEPNLDSPLTRTKLVLVLLLTLNGLQAGILGRRLTDFTTAPLPNRLLGWAAVTGVVSQICWWGAIFIGFWNAEH